MDEYVKGVLAGDRTILARTITLVESNSRAHMDMAQEVIKRILPHTGNSIRIGVTGVPGVGKSTFIEALGGDLLEKGKKVAVLAIDPSSTRTRGSILGDKTRMDDLARDSRCFIRPSPTGGTLGGVARKTRETMLVCEAAGFDVVLVETVGVGQSEISVRSMVDFFLLLMIAGAGDELQGIKRGVVEMADALVINKADGDNKRRAQMACAEYERAIHYLMPATEGWRTRVHTCSSLAHEGVKEIWEVVQGFMENIGSSGVFDRRRSRQSLGWMHAMLEEHVVDKFITDPNVSAALPGVELKVSSGVLPATSAVAELIALYEAGKQRGDP